jgi:dTDP-4-dehydrorhamnose reductase
VKILLLGANGQVGWELRRALAPLGGMIACTRADADLADTDRLRTVVRDARADAIVNAAVYTAVDKAESEPELATRINATAVGLLAEEAKRSDALLVHYSTDYVFDGKKADAYVETDPTAPLSHYGLSKLEGEQAIRHVGTHHLIFRTSWVYAPRGRNFPRTMLNLAAGRPALTVVADQVGAPTSAELIADITALALYRMAQPSGSDLAGTYHLTAAGATSWHAYCQHLLGLAAEKGWDLQAKPENVRPIATADYPTPAKRIANSRLATDKLRAAFGLTLPSWDAHLDRFLDELSSQGPKAS